MRLQADPAHLIGFHGETRDEVAEELADLRPDWWSGAAVATDGDGRLRGVLTVDAPPEKGRAFMYGPFVDVPAAHPAADKVWQRTADELFSHVSGLSRMDGVGTLDLFGHRQNRLLADFAARHDVAVDDTQRVFELAGAPLRALLVRAADRPSTSDDRVVPMPDDPVVREAVVRLHDRCFPTTVTPGAELVADPGEHIVVVLMGKELLGYATGFTQAEEYFVHMVGVDPRVRSRGVGRILVRGLLARLADRTGARNKAAALIRLGNDASERMFTSLGFDLTIELVNYRRVLQATARGTAP